MFWKLFLPALLSFVIEPQDTSVNGAPLGIPITSVLRLPKGEKIEVTNQGSPDAVGEIEGEAGYVIKSQGGHSRNKRSGRKVVRYGDEVFVVPRGEKIVVSNHGSPDEVGAIEGEGVYIDAFKEGHSVSKRAAIKDESMRWPDKTLPYLFDKSFTSEDKEQVLKAMEEWSRHTCLIFRPARRSDEDKVKFVNEEGCYSFVGMVDQGVQDISLEKEGCRYLSTVLHEIGHALGMYHTQVRPDRDQYVKVDVSDVAKDNLPNFKKETWKTAHHYGVEYDFNSIMHYDGTSFAGNGELTIETLDPKMQKVIGTAKHLSFGDIEMMNKMYKCKPKGCRLEDRDCPGVSFVDQKCKCACPGPSPKNPVVPCKGSDNKGGPEPEPETQPPTQPETTPPTLPPTEPEYITSSPSQSSWTTEYITSPSLSPEPETQPPTQTETTPPTLPPTEPEYITSPSLSPWTTDPDYSGDWERTGDDTESGHGWEDSW